ncbi:hypothetical protein ACFL96_19730, partial [Thermoproteota archaeon]
DILSSLRQQIKDVQMEIPEELPPMAAGLIGFLGYDAIRLLETTVPDTNPDTIGIPMGMFMRPKIMLVFDSVTTSLYIITPVRLNTNNSDTPDSFSRPQDKVSAKTAYSKALKRLQTIVNTLNKPNVSSDFQAKQTKPHKLNFKSIF